MKKISDIYGSLKAAFLSKKKLDDETFEELSCSIVEDVYKDPKDDFDYFGVIRVSKHILGKVFKSIVAGLVSP